jgi:hypothetical protein
LIVREYPNSPGFFGAGLGIGGVASSTAAAAAGKLPNIDNPVFPIVPEPEEALRELKIDGAAVTERKLGPKIDVPVALTAPDAVTAPVVLPTVPEVDEDLRGTKGLEVGMNTFCEVV